MNPYLFPVSLLQLRVDKGTPLQYSCLENPMDGGAWWAAVHGIAEGRTQLSDFTFTFHFHALEREMATHPSVLAWRIPGTGEPGGLPSLGSHRVRHDWSDLAAAVAAGLINSDLLHLYSGPKTMNREWLGKLRIETSFTKINCSASRIKNGRMDVEYLKTTDVKAINNRFPRTL